MSSSFTYTASEMSGAGVSSGDLLTLKRKLIEAGYTPDGLTQESEPTTDFSVQVTESSVVKATLLTDITNATIPTALALDTGVTADVTADGVDTLTVSITGADDAVVNIKWAGALKIDARQVTLDGSGDGSVVIGTYATGFCTDATGVVIQFVYADGRAAGTSFLLTIT